MRGLVLDPEERPVLLAPGNYDADMWSDATGLSDFDASRTVQSEAEDADINVIVRRFGITGELPVSRRVPLPDVFVDSLDYRQALDEVIAAQKAFDAQPAAVRARFANDVGAFVEFFNNDSNRAEAERLGLVAPRADAPVAASDAPGGTS